MSKFGEEAPRESGEYKDGFTAGVEHTLTQQRKYYEDFMVSVADSIQFAILHDLSPQRLSNIGDSLYAAADDIATNRWSQEQQKQEREDIELLEWLELEESKGELHEIEQDNNYQGN